MPRTPVRIAPNITLDGVAGADAILTTGACRWLRMRQVPPVGNLDWQIRLLSATSTPRRLFPSEAFTFYASENGKEMYATGEIVGWAETISGSDDWQIEEGF